MQQNYNQILEDTKTIVLGIIDMNNKGKWELDSNKDGYTVHTQVNPVNEIRINRTETETLVDFQKLVKVALDLTCKPQYDEKIKEVKLLERVDDDTAIYYVKAKPPTIIIDARDFIVLVKKFILPDGSVLIISKSIEHAKYPPNKGTERGDMIFNCTRIQQLPNNKVRITLVIHIDLKGNIPKMAMNQSTKFQAEGAKKFIEYAQKQ